MEQKTLTTKPSLLELNEYCLFRLFEYLDLDDSINFGNSCRYLRFVADRVFKKYSEFKLLWMRLKKGEQYLDFMLSHIGRHISSLHINLLDLNVDISKFLTVIDSNCKNLKRLTISEYKGSIKGHIGKDVSYPVYNFENIELLTLHRFKDDSDSTKYFLQSFYHLKCVYLVNSLIFGEVEMIFRNNPDINIFYSRDVDSLRSLSLIPNVEKMFLGGYRYNDFERNGDAFLALNRLTKLELRCNDDTINNVLRNLAKKGIMEEMVLKEIKIDDDFFDILTSFNKIQLLTIDAGNPRHEGDKRLKRSIIWPTSLKHLRLGNFELTLNDFIEIIRHLNSLQRLDLCMSSFAESDLKYFENVTICSKETVPRILKAVNASAGNQCREIILPVIFLKNENTKHLIKTDRINISYKFMFNECHHLGIKIDFPAVEFW